MQEKEKYRVLTMLTCHNRKEKTERCLWTLSGQNTKCEFTFIVVDDGSTDGTMEMLVEQKEHRKSDMESLASAIQGLTEVITIFNERGGSVPKVKAPAAKKTENLSADQYQQILNTYNDCCGKLPKATKLTDKRKRAIRICLEQGFTLEDFRAAVKKAALIPFFNGNGDRNWRANFDFIIKPDNLQKIIEDTYGSGQENSHSYDINKLFEHSLNTVPTIK